MSKWFVFKQSCVQTIVCLNNLVFLCLNCLLRLGVCVRWWWGDLCPGKNSRQPLQLRLPWVHYCSAFLLQPHSLSFCVRNILLLFQIMFQTQSPPWPWAGYHIRRLTKKVEEKEEVVVRRATCYEMSSNNCLCLLRRLGSLAQGGCQCQTRGAMAGPTNTTPAAPCPASHTTTGVQQVSLHSHWAGHRPWTPHTVKLYITWSFREALAMILLILHNQKDLKQPNLETLFRKQKKLHLIWFYLFHIFLWNQCCYFTFYWLHFSVEIYRQCGTDTAAPWDHCRLHSSQVVRSVSGYLNIAGALRNSQHGYISDRVVAATRRTPRATKYIESAALGRSTEQRK